MPAPVPPPRDLRAEANTPASRLIGADAPELFRLGAVYVNGERLSADRPLRAGEYIRIHDSPRRFPVDGIRWRNRMVRETADYVAVDKPAGIPVHPTCDNAVENVLTALSAFLGRELLVCHRLDIATRGLLILAKSRAFRREFGRWLEEGRVEKGYRALTAAPPPVGDFVHHVPEGSRPPYTVAAGGKPCRLRVLAVRPRGEEFEAELRPLTGRHHQIRLQLAALGAPILGDTLYGSPLPAPDGLGPGESIALHCGYLRFPGEPELALAAPWP